MPDIVLDKGQTIYRYEVPVDDHPHTLSIQGNPLFVACRSMHTVEFWAPRDDSRHADDRTFIVIGTGQPVRHDGAKYVGTALAGGLVWHLLELT